MYRKLKGGISKFNELAGSLENEKAKEYQAKAGSLRDRFANAEMETQISALRQ